MVRRNVRSLLESDLEFGQYRELLVLGMGCQPEKQLGAGKVSRQEARVCQVVASGDQLEMVA